MLRAHSGRLHSFPDNDAVVEVLNGLIEYQNGPMVVKLPRTPGRKDSEYMHLFSGPVDIETHSRQASTVRTRERDSVSELAQRVDKLEAEVEELRTKLNSLL